MVVAALFHQQQQKLRTQRVPGLSSAPVLSMPPAFGFIGNDTPATATAAAATATGTYTKLSPRGHNEYPLHRGVSRWNIHAINSWISLLLSFFALVMVAIMFFNWHGGDLTTARDNLPAPPPLLSGEMAKENGLVTWEHSVKFTLKGLPGQYSRWPEQGALRDLDMFALSEMRLCCRVGNRYFMCDYGQGASSDLGVECFVEHVPSEGGAHLLLNVQSEHMNGAECVFHWKSIPPPSPVVRPLLINDKET